MSSSTDKKSHFITSEALKKIYDDCALERFNTLSRTFYIMHWLFHFLVIFLSSTSAAVTIPANNEFFSNISTISGFSAGIITSILSISNFKETSTQCTEARYELNYYISNNKSMPKHVYDKIGGINLLCFKHPRKCVTLHK